MKRYIETVLLALAALTVLAGCTRDDDPKLGERITDIKLIATATETPNVYHIATSRKDVIGFWTLGNGLRVDGANEVYAEYPFAGTYQVNFTGYSNGGKTNSASVVIPVVDNNLDLLSDPIYELIAGEIGSPTGKTWVMDSLLYGHVANLNASNLEATPNNMALNVDATEKVSGSDLRLGKTLYDDKATFLANAEYGLGFLYENKGSSLVTNTGSNVFKDQTFMKASSWSPTTAIACNSIPLPPGYTGDYNSDWQVDCTPPSGMVWLLTQQDGTYYINFPDVANGPGGFLFFALDWLSGYEIISLTEDRMVVRKETLSGTNFGTRSVRRLVFIREGSPSGVPLEKIPEDGSYVN